MDMCNWYCNRSHWKRPAATFDIRTHVNLSNVLVFQNMEIKKHIKRNTKNYHTTVWNPKPYEVLYSGVSRWENQNRKISKPKKGEKNATNCATNLYVYPCVETQTPSPTTVEVPCLMGMPRCRILNSPKASPMDRQKIHKQHTFQNLGHNRRLPQAVIRSRSLFINKRSSGVNQSHV